MPSVSEAPGSSTRSSLDERTPVRYGSEQVFAKALTLTATALVLWAVLARPLGAHGDRTLYTVKPYDTVWTIAAAHYGGDVRDGVWQIERANHLGDPTIRAGEVLVLP
jgi:nucleoid-associated protein YgaU